MLGEPYVARVFTSTCRQVCEIFLNSLCVHSNCRKFFVEVGGGEGRKGKEWKKKNRALQDAEDPLSQVSSSTVQSTNS